jgi:rhodanese-related sulfurtransferase
VRSFERIPRRDPVRRVPEPVPGEPGLFVVDGTWGRIRPMELAPGVTTVGELEVIAHLEAGRAVVDCRRAEAFAQTTIPGAVSLPHDEVVERMAELDRAQPAVLFCNGPQCAATPDAIRSLLSAGHPAGAILYYRGGLHDWMTLGLPVAPG